MLLISIVHAQLLFLLLGEKKRRSKTLPQKMIHQSARKSINTVSHRTIMFILRHFCSGYKKISISNSDVLRIIIYM